MKLVVPYLLMLIKFLNGVLFKFQCFLVEKFLQNSPSDNPVSEKYRALRVDAMPIIETRELLDYRQLLSKYLKEHGKPLKPVNRRIHNLTSMSKDEKADFDKNPYKYKLHYYYRVFDIKLESLKKDATLPGAVDLSRIRNAKYVLGLVLTYHINYGLSTRQTACILWDIHNIKISHQTIANYAASAARVVKPFVDDYPYELSSSVSVCGDETYIKILGIRHYVFFMMDAIKKIVTSYSIFLNRDGVAAIKACLSLRSSPRTLPLYLMVILFMF